MGKALNFNLNNQSFKKEAESDTFKQVELGGVTLKKRFRDGIEVIR